MARQNLASLDARQATRRALYVVVLGWPTRAASAGVRDDAKARSTASAAEEPRAIVEPETDSEI